MTTISSQKLIAILISDYNIDKTDYAHRYPDWIQQGLEMMEIPELYEYRIEPVNIDNKEGILPCDYKYIHSLWVNGNGKCYCGKNISPLTIRNTPMLGVLPNDIEYSTHYGYIAGNRIKTSFNKGKILVAYKAMLSDEKGYPMIPDDAFVKDALPYYILHRLMLSGWEHPLLNYATVVQEWERKYPRAGNSASWFTKAEMQEFTEMWNNPYIGNLVDSLEIH